MTEMTPTVLLGAELKPPGRSVPQDWAALARWLARWGAELGPTPGRQFAGGFGNLNYLIEIDGKSAVLRRPPSGPLPRGANDMGREYRILSVLWQAYPLAPRALFFCAEPGVLGAPFQIIEYRAGLVIRDELPPSFAGRQDIGETLSRQMVESLAALHAVDPTQIGLTTLGRPVGFLGRTLDGWLRRGAALGELIDSGTFTEIAAWLRCRVPADVSPSLIHSDFKLDNMILDPATLAPVAVVDWDMGTRGDPLWDLAVLLSYWAEPEDPDCIHRMRQMPTMQAGFWSRRQVLEAYHRLSGHAVDDFTYYRVMSSLRSAIVFLQLFDRYRWHPEENMHCAGFGGLGRELLEYALEVARGRAE
jgi:aminoglycoside phosphotransferase (APT) family kinase protein